MMVSGARLFMPEVAGLDLFGGRKGVTRHHRQGVAREPNEIVVMQDDQTVGDKRQIAAQQVFAVRTSSGAESWH